MADCLEEEFNKNMSTVQNLLPRLKHEDKKICVKWIKKIIALKSNDLNVKKNRNFFLQYFLRVLEETVPSSANTNRGFEVHNGGEYISRWSPDKRTYIAAKPIPGRGALVYMAVCKEPLLGWDYSNKIK